MSVDRHPGWAPNILRRFREAHGLTQDGLAERLRGLPEKSGFTPPAATAEMIRRHELGRVFPGVAYRRSYSQLFGVTEPELGFRPPLPGESVAAGRTGRSGPPAGDVDTDVDVHADVDVAWSGLVSLAGSRPQPPDSGRLESGRRPGVAATAESVPAGAVAAGAVPAGGVSGGAVLPGSTGGGQPEAVGSSGTWTRRSTELLAAYLAAAVQGPTGARPSAGAVPARGSASGAPIVVPAARSAGPARARPVPAPAAAAATRPAQADEWDAVRLAHEWLLLEPPQVAELAAGRHVGAALAEKVEGRVGQFRRLDDYVGGRDLVSLVERELLGTVTMLREAVYDAAVGRRLLSSVAQLCQLAGWIAADAGRHGAAVRFLTGGIRAAHAGGDTALAANLISTQAYQMVNHADARQGVLLAQTACAGVGRSASATTRALLADRLAWAHARAGERRACEQTLAVVERLYDRADPAADPAWVYWLDAREIDVMAGRCWTELRRPDRAEDRLRHGLTGYDPLRAREISLYETWFAEAHLQRGDVEQACERAVRAARLDARVNSARTAERLRMLARRLGGYRSVRAVREFDEVYRTLRETVPGGGRPRPEPAEAPRPAPPPAARSGATEPVASTGRGTPAVARSAGSPVPAGTERH
ncbi:helix-turn-helix transcriptional regulator [Frankia sp. AvcI1]|uniref:helix-turn-helix domain-containing protein n=1 Tax=Frankia sp. AvcI1 TaxID=573496 RepID=UPI0021195BDB|nr:helix-turn-helix transcriptional regulator [Frankia sp. AvcI1]